MLGSNGHFPHIAGHEMTGNLTDGTLVAIELNIVENVKFVNLEIITFALLMRLI